MKICMFTNTYLPHVGGVAGSVAGFAAGLREAGHRVVVVAPSFGRKCQHTEEHRDVIRVPAIQNFNGGDFAVRIPVPTALSKKLERFQPDLIHSHHPFMLGDTALRAARRWALPLVFTHHTLYERYTHYVPLSSKGMQRYVIKLAVQYANLCTHVVCPSESVAQLLRERGVASPLSVLPTGIDTGLFNRGENTTFRRRQDIPEDAFLVGTVGRLAPEKNLGYLARAVAEFLYQHPNAYFAVVGDGPSRHEIEQQARLRGTQDRLRLVGVRSGTELRDAYRALDVFVFASTSETQGLVLAEAMASGVPVVGLEASGTREMVLDGDNGRLLAPDVSPEFYARVLSELAASPDHRATLAANALRTAQSFSRERCTRALENLYETARKENGRVGAGTVTDGGFKGWETLLRSVKVEWEMLANKTSAFMGSMRRG